MYVELWHLVIVLVISFAVGAYVSNFLCASINKLREEMIHHIQDVCNSLDQNLVELHQEIVDKNTPELQGKIIVARKGNERISFKVERVDDGK